MAVRLRRCAKRAPWTESENLTRSQAARLLESVRALPDLEAEVRHSKMARAIQVIWERMNARPSKRRATA